jgi:hypothetical protein
LPFEKEDFYPLGLIKHKQSFELYMGSSIAEEIDYSSCSTVLLIDPTKTNFTAEVVKASHKEMRSETTIFAENFLIRLEFQSG